MLRAIRRHPRPPSYEKLQGRLPLRISVITACRNERTSLPMFLASLRAQTSGAFEFEALIADGCSTDGTSEILAAFALAHPWMRLIPNPRQIASAGLNAAFHQSCGAVIVRMDAHTRYAPDYISACVHKLAQTGAQVVGGPALIAAQTVWQRAFAFAHRSPAFAGGSRVFHPSFEGPVETVAYGCWRRETLFRAGLFDEAMRRNQDDELSFRIRRQGGVIWQSPSIRSWYAPRRSLAAFARQYFSYGFWKVYSMRKHRQVFRLRHVAPAIFVVGLGCAAAKPLLFAAALGAYASALLAALFSVVRRPSEMSIAPAAALLTAIAHISYGAGTLAGIFQLSAARRTKILNSALASSRPTT